jgi:ABC-type sugar transport system substrate-binding protein
LGASNGAQRSDSVVVIAVEDRVAPGEPKRTAGRPKHIIIVGIDGTDPALTAIRKGDS